MAGERQWLRYFKLTVAKDGSNTAALDLSDFRVKFRVTQAAVSRPCTAEITVYNVSDSVVNSIDAPTNSFVKNSHLTVILEAGYQERHSIIFQGDLWWKSTGRESETDTYLRLIAATGDRAHQYAVVNASIPKGSSQADVFSTIAKTMEPYGVKTPNQPTLMATPLARGKVLYAMSRDAMQNCADVNNFDWGYTDQGLIAIPKTGKPADDRVVILNAASGLLDRPALDVGGLQLRALLNPDLEFGRVIQVDTSTIQGADYSTAISSNSVAQNQAATGQTADENGLYIIKSREFVGDTRGNEWFVDIIATAYNPAVGIVAPDLLTNIPNI